MIDMMRSRTTTLLTATLAAVLALACGSADPEATPRTGSAHFRVFVRNVSQPGTYTTSTGSALDVVFAPGVFQVHGEGAAWLSVGAEASPALERLAEDGDVTDALIEAQAPATVVAGSFGADVLGVSYGEAAIKPGDFAQFLFDAKTGDHLELGMMWAQSNDVFVATAPEGIALFDGAEPRTGVTSLVSLWDAGTEINQEPGLGDAQAPRQPSPDYGAAEGGVVTSVTGNVDAAGFSYPPLSDTLQLEITVEN